MRQRRKFWYRRNYLRRAEIRRKRSTRVIVELINEKTVNTIEFTICEDDS